MRRTVRVFLLAVCASIAIACSSSRPSDTAIVSSTTTKGPGGVPITDEMIGRSRGVMKLSRQAADGTYGYSETMPIKVGGGFGSGSDRTYQYLNALRGPNGEMLHYSRVGTCCSFEAPSSPFGRGLLEVFEVTLADSSEPKRLYFNWYEEGVLFIPVGLSAAP